jgi:sugar-specific transcriptional regulator TrmB
MEQLQIIQKYLTKLGIGIDCSKTYIELTKLGPSSALQLAKQTGFSRTQVYRFLDELQKVNLVSSEQLSYGTLFRALPFKNIEGLIANREAETAAIRRNLDAMATTLQSVAGSGGPKASVHHYYGLAGLKQVNWNLTKAEDEYRVFEVSHLSHYLDKAFARRCREQFVAKNTKSYDLTNATEVFHKDLDPMKPENSFYRHVDPKVLAINFEAYIYNDAVTLLDYSSDQIMALEIHHKALNTLMKQLFDATWATAQPLEIK